MLLKILRNIRYLARQGLAFRGNNEKNSNFHQLLMLKAEEDPALTEWLASHQYTNTSPCIENEMLQIMALSLMKGIS